MTKKEYLNIYRRELLESVIPFWEKYSPDKEYGGFFTCLAADGKVFDTDKFIWLQARQVWTFSMLYNKVEQKKEWLDMALHGARFLAKHGRDELGNWYFSLNQQGQPLIQPYNIFSDCFACMAFGQLYLATGDQQHADIAIKTFEKIQSRQENPKGRYNKSYPGTRPLRNFALPMILSNLALEIEPLLDEQLVEEMIDRSIREVMEVFLLEEHNLILENVRTDGGFSDTFDGRLLNPGHAIEAMWFIMDLAQRKNDKKLVGKAVQVVLANLDFAWDKTFGGIYYFMDIKGHPPQQLEWDQKLWWVHLETLIALLKGFHLTGHPKCWEWFEKVHAYTWTNFPDPEHGEWYGYLNRRGEVSLALKGGKWKGCFHVPRGLFQCWKTLKKTNFPYLED